MSGLELTESGGRRAEVNVSEGTSVAVPSGISIIKLQPPPNFPIETYIRDGVERALQSAQEQTIARIR